MYSPMMEGLRDLDPAHDAPTGSPHDAQLLAILDVDRRGSRRHRGARPLLLTGVAAAVALAVAVAVASPWSAAPAYASWTAVPTVLTGSGGQDRSDACDPAAHQIVGKQIVDVPLHTVLVEVRGAYTYVLQAADNAFAECFVVADPAKRDRWDSVGTDAVLPQPLSADDPAADAITTLQNGTSSWPSGPMGPGTLTSAFGRVGTDVAKIGLSLTNGQTAEASIDNGWWAIWVPGGAALEGSAILTLTDGRTVAVSVQGSAAGR